MHIEAFANTDTGRKRGQNQDSFLIDRQLGLHIVCDGMGGHAAGDIASSNATRVTADVIRHHRAAIEQALSKPGGHFKVVKIVANAVHSMCQQLHAMATHDPTCAGMGTTLTMLQVVDDKAILAHVGDSRLYLLRSGELHQLTNDHTLANELVQTGRVDSGSPEAARYNHVLTRCIGHQESVDVETLLFDLFPEDRFLLCSDGLSNYFADDDEVISILSGEDLEQIPAQLTDLANSRGGNDNITAVVINVSAEVTESADENRAKLDALQNTFLCRNLTLNRRMRLAGAGRVQRFGANEWIVRKGDKRTGMFVVICGSCSLTRPSGTTVDLAHGDCFGETALARGDQYRIQVRSKEPVCLLHISRERFQGLVRRIPKLGRRLLVNLLDHISCQYDELLAAGEALTDFGVWVRDDDPVEH